MAKIKNKALVVTPNGKLETFIYSNNNAVGKKAVAKAPTYDATKNAPIIRLHFATLKSELKDYLDGNRYMTRCIFAFGIAISTMLTLGSAQITSPFWSALFWLLFVSTGGITIYYGWMWHKQESNVDKLMTKLKRMSIKQ